MQPHLGGKREREAMMKTYTGSCHYERTRFDVDLELDHVRECDCSICQRRGALNHRVPYAALRLLTPLDALSVYQWHTGNAKDYFCPTCGILPFRRPRGVSDRRTESARSGAVFGMGRECALPAWRRPGR